MSFAGLSSFFFSSKTFSTKQLTCKVGLHAFLSSADFFQNFQKVLSETLPECQTIWIQIRTDILSGMVVQI